MMNTTDCTLLIDISYVTHSKRIASASSSLKQFKQWVQEMTAEGGPPSLDDDMPGDRRKFGRKKSSMVKSLSMEEPSSHEIAQKVI